MAVTYTKEQREYAKQNHLELVTLSACGMEFQGPATREEAEYVLEFIGAFLRQRGKRLLHAEAHKLEQESIDLA